MDALRIVLTACATEADAVKISKALLKADLAACCNIIPGVRSLFKWRGKLEDGQEVILLIKTRGGKVNDLMFAIDGLHGYDLPGIEVLTVEAANKAFGAWVNEATPD